MERRVQQELREIITAAIPEPMAVREDLAERLPEIWQLLPGRYCMFMWAVRPDGMVAEVSGAVMAHPVEQEEGQAMSGPEALVFPIVLLWQPVAAAEAAEP
jgi:hypothetical protein